LLLAWSSPCELLDSGPRHVFIDLPYSLTVRAAKDEDADLKAVGAPKSIHEAAERGNTGFIVRAIERTLDFDINQKARALEDSIHGLAPSAAYACA